tara:strand:- start:267 stop:842 length:576 start_codon:yes stop_codon:yes gene_type:complete
MGRGGNHAPDDFSPYKTADGRKLKLLKSSKSSTGYWCVIGPRGLKGKFYVKKKLDVAKGSKRSKVFPGQPSARAAAIALAEYTDEPYELPAKADTSKEKRLEKLHKEAWELLRVPNPKWSDEETAAKFEAAGDFENAALYRMELPPWSPPVVDGVASEPRVPERVPAAVPATVFDPAILAKVASIKANGLV